MNRELTENEKKKEFLNSYQKALRREQEILDEIQQLRADKMFPSAAFSDGLPKGCGQNDLSDYIVLLDEQLGFLKTERLERAKIRSKIEKSIRAMKDDEEQRVLRLRYIKGLKWEEIAVEMGYSWQHTHKIHAKALNSFKTCD